MKKISLSSQKGTFWTPKTPAGQSKKLKSGRSGPPTPYILKVKKVR